MHAEEITAYLAAPHIAVVATINRHGHPHLTPNWYRYDGKVLTLITRKDRLKYRFCGTFCSGGQEGAAAVSSSWASGRCRRAGPAPRPPLCRRTGTGASAALLVAPAPRCCGELCPGGCRARGRAPPSRSGAPRHGPPSRPGGSAPARRGGGSPASGTAWRPAWPAPRGGARPGAGPLDRRRARPWPWLEGASLRPLPHPGR